MNTSNHSYNHSHALLKGELSLRAVIGDNGYLGNAQGANGGCNGVFQAVH